MIVERKRLEIELQRTLAERVAILENSLVGIAFVRTRTFVWMNKAFEQDMLGFDEGELVGQSVEVVYPTRAVYEQMGPIVDAAMSEHGVFRTENRVRRKDGTLIWCLVSGRALDRHDVPRGTIWTIADITKRKEAEAEGKYIRQTGGSGNYGHCKIRIKPNEPGKGYEFVNDTKGGSIPKEFIKPIDQGIREALDSGILAGFPVVDVMVSLYDGSYHDVDSNEMAYKIAGSMAFKEAARKASPVLLEPVMAVEVTVPEDFVGTIIGDINSRRGRIESLEHAAGSQLVKAIVPLKEMFGYVNDIRSSTQGRASYSMQFARYEEAPRMIADEIIGRAQGKA